MPTVPTVDQIVFAHEPLNISDNLGFGPVAYSCGGPEAVSFWRVAERIVRPPGSSSAGRDSLAFGTAAHQDVIVWRVTAQDNMKRSSLRCHTLFAPSGRLTARLALGLTGRDWSGRRNALDAERGRTLEALDPDALLQEAAEGAELLRSAAAERADTLQHLASWLLFEPGRQLSIAEAECVGDDPAAVLLGLVEILEPLVPGPWTFSTLEYEESGPYRLMVMPSWPVLGRSTHQRLRLHGQEPPADWASEAARLLVARYVESGPQTLGPVSPPGLPWLEMAPEERCRELLSQLRPRIAPGPATNSLEDACLQDSSLQDSERQDSWHADDPGGQEELPPAEQPVPEGDEETTTGSPSGDDLPPLPRGWPVQEAPDTGQESSRAADPSAGDLRRTVTSVQDTDRFAEGNGGTDPAPAPPDSLAGHESFTFPAPPAAPPSPPPFDGPAHDLPFIPAGLPPVSANSAPAVSRAVKGTWGQRRRRRDGAHAGSPRPETPVPGAPRRESGGTEWVSELGDMELVERALRCPDAEVRAIHRELERRTAGWDEATVDEACERAINQGLGLTPPNVGRVTRAYAFSSVLLYGLLVRRAVRRAGPARQWAAFLNAHGTALPRGLKVALQWTVQDYRVSPSLVHPEFFATFGLPLIVRTHGLTDPASAPVRRPRPEPGRSHAAGDSDDSLITAVVVWGLILILMLLFAALFYSGGFWS
ncbi:hypothetical protein [Streptomyces sp. NPDC002328]|uniref:hypothetical protein n=1 Tax=Streptomyces sp. NPDC002328 TaxID=3364642 RepID=UPI00369948C5